MSSNRNKTLATIRRVVAQSSQQEMDTAEVVAVPTHGQFVMIRRGGSATHERAYIENDIRVKQGERVTVVRPEQGRNWVVLMSFTDRRSGQAPNVPDVERALAAPTNFTGVSGRSCAVIHWEIPPTRPDVSVLLQRATNLNDPNSDVLYYVKGSGFVDVFDPGEIRYYRARCVDEQFRLSGWTSWISVAASGATFGSDSGKPANPTDGEDYFAIDLGVYYIAYDGEWHPISGISGVGNSWDVDLPPASPGAPDDEFSATWPGNWTEYDSGSIQAVSEASDLLTFSRSPNASTILTGARKDVPAGDFTIVCKMRLSSFALAGVGYVQAGLAVWNNAAVDASEIIIVGPGAYYDTSLHKGFGFSYFQANNDLGFLSMAGVIPVAGIFYYLRLRREGTTYFFDRSNDGLSWVTQNMSGYIGFVPDHFGLAIYNQSNLTITADFEFFRYRNVADDITDPVYGNGALVDHGILTGLADDDHTQYHNDTRGDARYSQLSHVHATLPELSIGNTSHYAQFQHFGRLSLVGNAAAWEPITIPAHIMQADPTNPPGFAQFKTNGSGSTGVFGPHFDANTEESMIFAVELPRSWNPETDVGVVFRWSPTNANAGNVIWGLEYTWANRDGTWSNTTLTTVTDAAAGSVDLQTSPGTLLAGSGKTKSSMLLCRVYRKAADAADTYISDAVLHAVTFYPQIVSLGAALPPFYGEKVYDIATANLIGLWPIWEAVGATIAHDLSSNKFDGLISGVTLGQTGIGDGQTCGLFDGSNDYIDTLSAGLAAAFSPTAGTINIWAAANAAAWTDGVVEVAMWFGVNGSNAVRIFIGATNLLSWIYAAGGTVSSRSKTTTSTAKNMLTLTWDKNAGASGEAKAFFNAVQEGPTLTNLGTWVGTPTVAVIGAIDNAGGSSWDGTLAWSGLWNRALTQAEITKLYETGGN